MGVASYGSPVGVQPRLFSLSECAQPAKGQGLVYGSFERWNNVNVVDISVVWQNSRQQQYMIFHYSEHVKPAQSCGWTHYKFTFL